MRVYLVRHGQAVSGDADPARPLTERGLDDGRKVAAFIRPLKLCVDCVWHSTKTRAAQTAELLAPALSTQKGCLEHPSLAPNDDVGAVKNELDRVEQDIMIVGHLPFLGRLASLLLVGNQSPQLVAFKQTAIVCLVRSPEREWRLDWIITPQILT